MSTPENLTNAIANTMSDAGYGISDQLFNALEEEFSTILETAKEEGEFTSLDTFLGALEYAANHVYNKVV